MRKRKLTFPLDLAEPLAKRTRRQTRSALLNDENVDPEAVTIREDTDGCDSLTTDATDEITELSFPKTPSKRSSRADGGKKGM